MPNFIHFRTLLGRWEEVQEDFIFFLLLFFFPVWELVPSMCALKAHMCLRNASARIFPVMTACRDNCPKIFDVLLMSGAKNQDIHKVAA